MKKIALLIDLENVSPQIIDQVMTKLTPLGSVQIKRAYADCSKASCQLLNWKEICLKYNIEIVHHFACKPNKNSSDILLAIDAIDIFHQYDIDLFCIVSSDSDFSSLVQRLKSHQREVIAMGSNPPNDSYTLLFEQFYQLSPEPESKPEPTPQPKAQPAKPPFFKQALSKLSKLLRPTKPKMQAAEPKKIASVPQPTSLNQEQQMIKMAFHKSKKTSAGYAPQVNFASSLTPDDRQFILQKYGTFAKFVRESPYLTTKPQPNSPTQFLIKPNLSGN